MRLCSDKGNTVPDLSVTPHAILVSGLHGIRPQMCYSN
jgi:hypothetical protein